MIIFRFIKSITIYSNNFLKYNIVNSLHSIQYNFKIRFVFLSNQYYKTINCDI